MASYTVISADEAEESFGVAEKIDYPYLDFEDEQEIRLYEGTVIIRGDFTTDLQADWNPFNVVIDGDLVVKGNVEWQDWGNGSFLFVAGNMTVENLLMQGCANVYVCGELRVKGAILGHHGSDGGVLHVEGSTTAQAIINTQGFSMEFDDDVEAFVIADEANTRGCKVDAPDDDCSEYLLPDFLNEDGGVDEQALHEALQEGAPYLRDV